MTALHLLLLTTLVLRTGERIAVEEPPRIDNGRVVFRSGGLLYSLPADEVEILTSPAPGAVTAPSETRPDEKRPAEGVVRPLAVTEERRRKLIAALEAARGGVPSDLRQRTSAERYAPPATPTETAADTREEWSWRREARSHEESVRRAVEELELLLDRIEQLRGEIHFFASQGFKPHQFTYQTTQLFLAREQLPRAELELRRAERAADQFREDARRQGVLPGWLR